MLPYRCFYTVFGTTWIEISAQGWLHEKNTGNITFTNLSIFLDSLITMN
jgi:hypothetical protein